MSFFETKNGSTHVSHTSQLLLFVREIDVDFEITEELMSVHSMHETTTDLDIFAQIENSVSEYNLEWQN